MKPDLALKWESEVGEGPIWDPSSRELIWIDVTQGKIHRFNPSRGSNETLNIPMHIGAVGLYSDTHLVAAVRDGFATIDKGSGSLTYLNRLIDDTGIRFNDGKCDPFGNFIAGTMRYEPEPGTAALYSCNPQGEVHEILGNIGLSNGLCWNEDGTLFYYIDTLTRQIREFQYREVESRITNGKVLYEFAASDGSPDGMTIDSAGRLWVAMWGGGKVMCIDHDGELVHEIPLPITQPTSVAFGGADFKTLFITSAKYQLSESQLAQEPLAGSIFSLESTIAGVSEPMFGKGR